MDQKDYARYKEKLLDMRVHLDDEIQRSIEAVVEEVQPVGEDAKEPSEGLEKELALEKSQEDILNALNAALDRIAAGTFGQCEMCATAIPSKRLDAIPYTAYCVSCERKLETG